MVNQTLLWIAGIAFVLFVMSKVFSKSNSNAKEYSEENEQEEGEEEPEEESEETTEEEESEDYETCDKCKQKIYEDKNGDMESWECAECGENCCKECCHYFEGADTVLCNECIDKEYPRKVEVQEKVVYKTLEPSPITTLDAKFDPSAKTKFD